MTTEQEDLYQALINRGHPESAIPKMSWEDMFSEYCQWRGLIGWGPNLIKVMEAAKIMTNQKPDISPQAVMG